MSSDNIYTSINPTYLYIKQHSITGLKYFGKTSRDPREYNGSGKYWKNHIKKYGEEHVVTLWVSDLYVDTSITNVALSLSELFDIVRSDGWANMKPEDGIDGGSTTQGRMWVNDGVNNSYIYKTDPIPDGFVRGRLGKFNDSEFQREMSSRVDRKKQSDTMKRAWKDGVYDNRDSSKCDTSGDNNPAKRPEVRKKISDSALNRSALICPHCNKTGKSPGMYKHHFNNCKHK